MIQEAVKIRSAGVFRKWIPVAMMVFASCSRQAVTPFGIDTGTGSFEFHGMVYNGPAVNGSDVLEGAFLFHGSDSLVALSSLGNLDLIVVFKGDSLAGSMQLTAVNTGEDPARIGRLSYFSRARFAEGVKSGHQYKCRGVWDFEQRESGDTVRFELPMNPGAIVLLPEERVVFPALHFFLFTLPQ